MHQEHAKNKHLKKNIFRTRKRTRLEFLPKKKIEASEKSYSPLKK